VAIAVSGLAVAPVKGMRLHRPGRVWLDRYGVAGDREFLVIDERNGLLLTTRTPALLGVEPCWSPEQDMLALHFPDGRVVQDTPVSGAALTTRLYDGRELAGRRVEGPWLPPCRSTWTGRCACCGASPARSATTPTRRH
jgi:hypothetical protein